MSVRRLWDKSSRPKQSKLPRCGSERSLLWLTTRRSRAGQASTRPSKLVSELKARFSSRIAAASGGCVPRSVDGSSFKLRHERSMIGAAATPSLVVMLLCPMVHILSRDFLNVRDGRWCGFVAGYCEAARDQDGRRRECADAKGTERDPAT